MGFITLRTTVGTVNFTGYLHVTLAKVPTGSPVVWEDWVNTPLTNYNFIIPGLDPDNYYMRFYEALTDSDLGTLRMELLVNALTGEWTFERRWYVVDGGGDADPSDGANVLTDGYLIGRTIEEVFKPGYGPLQPDVDYSFDDAIGSITLLTPGQLFSDGEKWSIVVKHTTGAPGGDNTVGLYSDILTVTEASKLLYSTDVGKLIRLKGSGSTQVITCAPLSSLPNNKGWFFDNTVGGTAQQVKILFTGSDKLYFNGMGSASNEFTEFWVGRGEQLLIHKFDDNYFEVRNDYKGVRVGEIVTRSITGAGCMLVTESGQLMDGDEWPRTWWWLNNVLPSTHKYITDTVTSGSFAHTQNRRGQFALHSTLKKFRMPQTNGLYLQGMGNFEGVSSENNPVRTIGWPGGIKDGVVGSHSHTFDLYSNGTFSYSMTPFSFPAITDNGSGPSLKKGVGRTVIDATLIKNTVENNGVIFCRYM